MYDAELRRVEQFRYLSRMLAVDDNDLPAMRPNLKKDRGTWGRLSCALAKESVAGSVAGMFIRPWWPLSYCMAVRPGSSRHES